MRDSRGIWGIPDWAIREISQAAPRDMEVVVVGAPADGTGDGGEAAAEAIDAVRGAEVFLGYGFPRPIYDAAREDDTLRWVHSAAAGVTGAIHPGMAEAGIRLTNSAGIHAEPMADTIIGMILYFARGLDYAVTAQHRHEWSRTPFDSAPPTVHEIEGSSLGIVGYGGIGQAVAKRALALGMKVTAWRRRPIPADLDLEMVAGAEGLDRVLGCRYVVLALPRTAATINTLSRERIASLRPETVIINVGRGELVDEVALAEALAEGRIRGAALDVFVREPLPVESPLWDLPNVLITPHVTATTDRFWRRETDLILENLQRYERDEDLVNLVDVREGY